MIDGAVSIRSSEPVQVGQFLLGQNLRNPPLPRGDPGLTILVPQEQFRLEYVFVTPSSYVPTVNGQSWVLVSREPGVAITLDGAPIEAESNTAMPADFLMQQMAWREALDEAQDEDELDVLAQQVRSQRRQMLESVGECIDVRRDFAAAAQQVRALMFIERFAEEVDRRLDALGQ